ncbi:hypothetical protein Q9R46_25725 [Paenibacillus sp. RRE4]|uniref:hypothetical protein n=1 Tax=Paenibacillus sp. RRE4 TaxID=2962587 RepID=UPI0028822D55|nr:hypothetical protein [Paenibacillus sp. RRE4]MDT0126070.1 hypothetical protein [Paenibacillus sp. RRE4]
MYLKQAIARINNIDWSLVGGIASKVEADLACEFLRRLACFFKEEGIRPIKPLVADIAKLLGDTEEVEVSDYCNSEVVEFLGENIYVKNIIQYYLHLAKYAEERPETYRHLNVYEPLIKILERKGLFVLRINALDIVNGSHIPLEDWYENFVNMNSLEID